MSICCMQPVTQTRRIRAGIPAGNAGGMCSINKNSRASRLWTTRCQTGKARRRRPRMSSKCCLNEYTALQRNPPALLAARIKLCSVRCRLGRRAARAGFGAQREILRFPAHGGEDSSALAGVVIQSERSWFDSARRRPRELPFQAEESDPAEALAMLVKQAARDQKGLGSILALPLQW